MTLYKHVINDLIRYTFLDNVERKGVYVYFTYGDKTKRLAYRATTAQLIAFIDKIKEEIGFKEIKETRDIRVRKELSKPMMFANVGEDK